MTTKIPPLTILDTGCLDDITEAGLFDTLHSWLIDQGLVPADVIRVEISHDNGALTGRVTERLYMDRKSYCARLHRHGGGCDLAARARDVVLSSPPPAALYDLQHPAGEEAS